MSLFDFFTNDIDGLINACERRDTVKIRKILEKDENLVNMQNGKGWTALLTGIDRVYDEVVIVLLNAGADPNQIANKDWTPLMHAVSQKNQGSYDHHMHSIVDSLLKAGADPNIDRNGWTALMSAAYNLNRDNTKLLLNSGADPGKVDNEGCTALMIAAKNDSEYNYQDCVSELLIKAGTDLNVQDKGGRTALTIALDTGCNHVAELLVKAGADPNKQDNSGKTALMIAFEKGSRYIAELLIKAGADLNILYPDGRTALMIASDKGYLDTVEQLLNAGADPNKLDNEGCTALMQTIKKETAFNQNDLVELLIKAGTDLNIQDIGGKTALIIALDEGCNHIAELLVKAGADPGKQDNRGRTALMIAKSNGYQGLIELLSGNIVRTIHLNTVTAPSSAKKMPVSTKIVSTKTSTPWLNYATDIVANKKYLNGSSPPQIQILLANRSLAELLSKNVPDDKLNNLDTPLKIIEFPDGRAVSIFSFKEKYDRELLSSIFDNLEKVTERTVIAIKGGIMIGLTPQEQAKLLSAINYCGEVLAVGPNVIWS